jgi:hypothetical protein
MLPQTQNQQLPEGVSSLVDIALRLEVIQMSITVPGMVRPSVGIAYPFQPSTVSSAKLPFFINELRNGQSDIGAGSTTPPAGTGQQARDSDFGMILCTSRKEGNLDLKLGIWDAALWIDSVYRVFARHLRLSHPDTGDMLPSVVDAKIKSWKLIEYPYGDMVFLGIEFILKVRERYAQTFEG